MKMVKSLLLGTAAGLVAMTGAQAADLPVKAKPVQYVKICSLYGAGFYYIPGTDTCIKVGGFARAEYNFNAGGSFTPLISQDYNRRANDVNARARAAITVDTRSQTEYGTLRSYFDLGATTTNNANGLYNTRAFIQWAGFTAGVAASYFDFFQFSDYSNQLRVMSSDTLIGDLVFAYTAQFGNGLSASLSVEDQTTRRSAILGGTAYGGTGWPDLVASLRADQAWGSAQIMGAIHDVKPAYYTFPTTHPSEKVGYAVGAGVKFNLPMLGYKDYMSAQVSYAMGATRYTQIGSGAGFIITNGSTTGRGLVSDAVGDPLGVGGLELTESWTVGAGYNHGWNKKWKSSLYGGYAAINYGTTAETYLATPAGKSNDFSFYQIGSRTVWTPVANLDLSVDVMYNHLNSASAGAPVRVGGSLADQSFWMAVFRAQRNFYP